MWQEILTQPVWGTVSHGHGMKAVTPKYEIIWINSSYQIWCIAIPLTPSFICMYPSFYVFGAISWGLEMVWTSKPVQGWQVRWAEDVSHSRWFVFRTSQTQGQKMSCMASIIPLPWLIPMNANAENQCYSGEQSFPNCGVHANPWGACPKADSDLEGLDRGTQCCISGKFPMMSIFLVAGLHLEE